MRVEGTLDGLMYVSRLLTAFCIYRNLNTKLFTATPQYKHIPTRHKREIIVVRGTETVPQKNRSYKELIEQLNASKAGDRTGAGAGEAVGNPPTA